VLLVQIGVWIINVDDSGSVNGGAVSREAHAVSASVVEIREIVLLLNGRSPKE
jgi:hypothetical protein